MKGISLSRTYSRLPSSDTFNFPPGVAFNQGEGVLHSFCLANLAVAPSTALIDIDRTRGFRYIVQITSTTFNDYFFLCHPLSSIFCLRFLMCGLPVPFRSSGFAQRVFQSGFGRGSRTLIHPNSSLCAAGKYRMEPESSSFRTLTARCSGSSILNPPSRPRTTCGRRRSRRPRPGNTPATRRYRPR